MPIPFALLASAIAFGGMNEPVSTADSPLAHVSQHVGVFTAPPKHVPTELMPDGPLLGNGDVGVVISGPPERQTLWLGKNDFWSRTPGDASILGMGAFSIEIPALKGAIYRLEQDLAHAEVRGEFIHATGTLRTATYVDADENLVVIQLHWSGATSIHVAVKFDSESGIQSQTALTQAHRPTIQFVRMADKLPGTPRAVAVASAIVGAHSNEKSPGELEATLGAGQTISVVASVLSDLDSAQFIDKTKSRVAILSPTLIDGTKTRHRAWWQRFWSKSFIEIPDKEIEKRWYAALYTMGSCSRAGKVAPGLWGNWVTTDHPAWHGDFHLNYNFQAPYYIVYSSNHPELSEPFYQAIQESVPNGRAMSKRHGWKGIHFPVCIGPWGLSPENPDGDWGQRSNAAYAALNFIWQYQYTQDEVFLRSTAYPYLREVAEFWEDYLRLEGDRYVIHNDSIHEGSGDDTNSILSLGLVRTLFKNLVPMSIKLGVDADRRAKWQDIHDRMSPFPTQVRNGRTVFRYSETGMAWNDGNTLGIQHIFPAGAIGLGSESRLLSIARNTIEEMSRWSDNNGFSSWYTACARIGIDPNLILEKMRKECDDRSHPNLVLNYGGGGIENVSGFLAINEMLMQSHEGVIRLFPVWPRNLDASFGGLRAVGAFLVSARQKAGTISAVSITSEKGGPLTIDNPWPDQAVEVRRSSQPSPGIIHSKQIHIPTSKGETIKFRPAV